MTAPAFIEAARKRGDVIAVADNDSSKWNQMIHGIPITPPTEIPKLEPDEVIISSTATYPIYQQLLEMGIDENRIKAPLLSLQNRKKWADLSGAHKGKRLFIVGNGPSLTTADLDRLHQQKELAFAFNKIYLTFSDTQFRPSYYLVDDNLVAQHNTEEIHALSGFPKFFPDYLLPVLGEPDSESALFYYDVPKPDQYQPRFSFDPFLIHSGFTCTYSALQIAMQMGFDTIIFIGLDFSFILPERTDGEVFTNEKEINHFSPNYRKPGETWNRPYLEQTREAYLFAKRIAEERGVRILNASRSTQLDVFPRVDFDSLFV